MENTINIIIIIILSLIFLTARDALAFSGTSSTACSRLDQLRAWQCAQGRDQHLRAGGNRNGTHPHSRKVAPLGRPWPPNDSVEVRGCEYAKHQNRFPRHVKTRRSYLWNGGQRDPASCKMGVLPLGTCPRCTNLCPDVRVRSCPKHARSSCSSRLRPPARTRPHGATYNHRGSQRWLETRSRLLVPPLWRQIMSWLHRFPTHNLSRL